MSMQLHLEFQIFVQLYSTDKQQQCLGPRCSSVGLQGKFDSLFTEITPSFFMFIQLIIRAPRVNQT